MSMKLIRLFIFFIMFCASTAFAQQGFEITLQQKIAKAKANNFSFETGIVTNFHINTNISSTDIQPTPSLAMPTLTIDLAITSTLNTDVSFALIYFVSDSVLYQPPTYDVATKTVKIEYPLSYYPVIKDMLYNAFYGPETQKRKLDIFWADDGNNKASAGLFQE